MNQNRIRGIVVLCLSLSLQVNGALNSENKNGKIILSNDRIQIWIDTQKAFNVCDFKAKESSRTFIKDIQTVEDAEGAMTKKDGGLEANANVIAHEITRNDNSIIVRVELRTAYLKINKTIILEENKSYFTLKYDYYILNKIPLRVLAAPLIVFPDWINKACYLDRYGKRHSILADSLVPNNKYSIAYPGLWYAAGDSKEGVLIVLPGLASDYGLFGWPPEWGNNGALLRNYNVGHLGIMFPHKLAAGSPDVKFSASLIIGVYQESPEKLFDGIRSCVALESPKLKPAPANNTAVYYGQKSGVNIWLDNESAIHRKKESLSKAKKSQLCQLTAAKNQDVSLQIVLNAEKSVDIKSVDVAGFDADVYLMEYITLKSPSKIFTGRSADSYPSAWPDPLKPFFKTTIQAGVNHGLLITFKIPDKISAGNHPGNIIVNLSDGNKIEIPINVSVYDFSLSRPRRFYNICNVYGYVIKHYAKLHGLSFDPYTASAENKYSQIFSVNNLNVTAYSNKSFETATLQSLVPFVSTVFIPGEESVVLFEGTYYPKTYKGGRLAPQPGPMPVNYKTAIVQRYKQGISHIRQSGYKGDIYALVFDDPLSVPAMREGLLSVIPDLLRLDHGLKLVGCMKNNFDDEVAIKLDAVITAPDISEKLQLLIKDAQAKKPSLQWWSCINPWTAIDALPVGTRSLFWTFAAKGIAGSWNWDGMALWDQVGGDVYEPTKQGNWWGEGYLIYPPANSPRPSLRLIQFRCGVDDYEYLMMLRDEMARCENKVLLSAANNLLNRISAWEINPAEPEINANNLSELKCQIADLIVEMKKANDKY